jgi:hypothetical protein
MIKIQIRKNIVKKREIKIQVLPKTIIRIGMIKIQIRKNILKKREIKIQVHPKTTVTRKIHQKITDNMLALEVFLQEILDLMAIVLELL